MIFNILFHENTILNIQTGLILPQYFKLIVLFLMSVIDIVNSHVMASL